MASINIFDRSLKVIARNHADLFLRLALPDTPIQLSGKPENVELSLPVQPVDFVHRVVYADQEHLLHIEFQLEHFADFPRRMCTCHGALTQQFKLPVLSFAFYLKYRKAPIPNEYVARLGEQVINRFTYPVLKLWDYTDQIRQGHYRELAPLLVILVDKPDEQTLQSERALILAEPDREKRADLLAVALSIATRSFDTQFLRNFFREEIDEMKHAPLMEEWLEEATEQGRLEGIRTQQRKDILRTLRVRFSLTDMQADRISQDLTNISDLAQLDELAEHALRDFSLVEFHKNLDRLAHNLHAA
jgi:predicted transposase YdaD